MIAELDPAMSATVRAVGAALSVVTNRWWVIGSAAVALQGVSATVGDVDVLLSSPEDAARLLAILGLASRPGAPDDRFQSTVFARWTALPRPVEIMAGLHVHANGCWRPVELTTRTVIGGYPVPSRAELAALLRRFGRPKDLVRATALDAIS